MKPTCYSLVEEQTENGQWCYGITVFEKDAEGNATSLYRVDNVTYNKKKIEELIHRCNSLKLSPIHLDEVIEDFLYQNQ